MMMKLQTTLQRTIKFGKSVLKASYSWRSNNMIGKQILRINNTITKKKLHSTTDKTLLRKFSVIANNIGYSLDLYITF